MLTNVRFTARATPGQAGLHNVPAFIEALACMVQIEHISISCPDQEPSERHRRSAVDYALISLRIAIERVELPHLTKLSLDCHPAALLYLRPTLTFGGTPSGGGGGIKSNTSSSQSTPGPSTVRQQTTSSSSPTIFCVSSPARSRSRPFTGTVNVAPVHSPCPP